MRRATGGNPRATFTGVRKLAPDDIIDADTVQTLIDRYNVQRKKARQDAALEEVADVIASERDTGPAVPERRLIEPANYFEALAGPHHLRCRAGIFLAHADWTN